MNYGTIFLVRDLIMIKKDLHYLISPTFFLTKF
jgi:hypothetical protein